MLWHKPAAYDWDFWTVEAKGDRQFFLDYINEVFVECSEVKYVLCIDHDSSTFEEFVWDDSGRGAIVSKRGSISFSNPKRRDYLQPSGEPGFHVQPT